MAQFSANLTPNWEKTPSQGFLSVSPSGYSNFQMMEAGVPRLKIFNPDGVATGEFVMAAGDIPSRMTASPTGASEGFYFMVRSGNTRTLRRIRMNGVLDFETPFHIMEMAGLPNGNLLATGYEPGEISRVFQVTPSGTFTSTPSIFTTAGNVRVHSNNLALIQGDLSGRIARYDPSTSTFSPFANVPASDVRDFGYNGAADRVSVVGTLSGMENKFFSVRASDGQVSDRYTTGVYARMTTMTNGNLALVGRYFGTGYIAVVGADSVPVETAHQIPAHPYRNITVSALAPNGDVAIRQDNGKITVFTSAGAVRRVIPGGVFREYEQLTYLADGSLLLHGQTNQGLQIQRISSDGVVLYDRLYAMPNGAVNSLDNSLDSVTQVPGSDDVILTPKRAHSELTATDVFRFNPAGGIVYRVRYGGNRGDVAWADGQLLLGTSDGKLRRLNPATGLPLQVANFPGYASVADLPGVGAVATRQDGARLRRCRIDPANLAVTHSSLANSSWNFDRMHVGAAGPVALSLKQTGTERLAAFAVNGANMTAAMPFTVLPETMKRVTSIGVSSANQAYFMAEETGEHAEDTTAYVAKYNANGTLAVEKRILHSKPGNIHHSGSLLWLTGIEQVRNLGFTVFAKKYTR